MNAALRPISREAFVAEITRDVPETPMYFLHSRDTNKAGPRLLAERDMPPALEAREFARVSRQPGVTVLDTRSSAAYGAEHVPSSLHVGLDGQYASWVGTLVGPDERIVIIAEPDRIEEAVMRLTRVGYENVVGVLQGGLEAWKLADLPVRSTRQIPVQQALAPGSRVLDVRRPGEWDSSHYEGAVHVPLHQLAARAGDLDRNAEWTVVCASGFRSSIATSVLERAGFGRVINAAGGMDAYRKAGLPVASS
jgi:rhodanese-related sulfurtransferase